ncbi:MAG TPA: polysaccharide deacetylase family protein [Magnetospirillaceae bacterium]|nr:polysaccharide deacetylase family protein [Magnetospirillaceae bacterium]
MPIWIFSALVGLALALPAEAEIVTRLPTREKIVALTFDACESKKPAFLDRKIADYLLSEKIPFTIFVSGRFARHNQEALKELAAEDFVELENHSLDHDNHMELMSDEEIRHQIAGNDALLAGITGRHTRYFRFPAGNHDDRGVALAESLGFKVVHWSFASGDPAKEVTAQRLQDYVLSQTRPGSILIFHINGRGWNTAEALPQIVEELRRRGYRFTTLAQALS